MLGSEEWLTSFLLKEVTKLLKGEEGYREEIESVRQTEVTIQSGSFSVAGS